MRIRLALWVMLSFVATNSIFGKASSISELKELAEAKKLWQDPYWLKLLHYDVTWWQTKSQVTSSDFFLAENGRFDPKEELFSNIEVMLGKDKTVQRGEDRMPTACRFPARYKWLSKQLGLGNAEVKLSQCEVYSQYLSTIFPKDISFVFASYYVDSPSSTFGHTFLRFGRPADPNLKESASNELLDHGISYAAVPTTENPILYPLFGMTGFFPGQFSVAPYFYKVQEYNFQSRDLWSYHLNLTDAEKAIIVDHLWEISASTFDYYFFTQNCSYHILILLELARPELKLVERMPPWIIPSDTVNVVAHSPGLVSEVTYRPSLYQYYRYRLYTLSTKQQAAVINILRHFDSKNPDYVNESVIGKAQILDTMLDYIEYRSPSQAKVTSEQSETLRFQTLQQRAKLDYISETLKIPFLPTDQPDAGHASARATLGWADGQGNTNSALTLGMRFAHHDILDFADGFPGNASIDFFNFEGRYSQDEEKAWLDKISMVHVMTLPYQSALELPLSWEIDFGIRNRFAAIAPGHWTSYVEGGAGWSFWHYQERLAIFGLMKGALDLGQNANDGYDLDLSIGPKLGVYYFAQAPIRSALTYDIKKSLQFDRNMSDLALTSRFAFRKNQAVEAYASEQVVHDRSFATVGLRFYHYF